MWNRRPQFNYVTQRTTLLRDFRPEQEPTPPVAAGRYTFIGGSDGYLRCIDNTNGTVAWSYLTGGRIYATPTVWNGCVYAGSGDGYAYCIEAHTGRLVWRFRAAPVDMRMNLYGYLASAWPILTGVMVDANGNAYFAAGLQSEYGTHVYCVNAATGALKWQNNKSATVLNAVGRIGVVPCGYMTIAKNRLIIANSSAAAASFDLATGAYDTTSKRSLMTVMDKQSARYSNFVINGSVLDCATRGREIGVLDSTYFMTGGSAIFQDNALRTMVNFGGEQFIGFQTLNANGAPLYPLTRICETTIIAPMWDNQYYYHMLVGDERLEGYRISDFITALNARNPLPTDSLYFADSLYFGVTRYNTQIKNLTEVRPWFPTRLFSNTTLHFNATVLTPNAIVATFSTDKPGLQDITVPENTNWYVGALDRNTGSMLWQIALPDVATGLMGQPVLLGLAVDRNGNIIVTQYNGNVLCYGTGPVSVAGDEPVMPAVVPAPEPVASSAMWEAAGTARAQEASHGSAGQVAGPSVSPTPTEQFAMLRPLFFDEQTAGRDSARVVDASAACRRSPQMCGKSHAQEDGYAPRDMRWTPERSCLAVSAVRASSSVGKNTASNSIDHDLRTRWTPAAAGPQWTTYDLGNVQEIAAVSVVWYGQTSSRTAFSLETSLDGKAFSQVDAGHLAGRGTNTTLRSFVPQQARFVRLGLLPAQGSACPSIYEVGIHGGEARRAEAR
jgi:outer membrane protein assembly factor BamB